MTITMNEKEKTNITGIYLKDFEIKKTSLSETNCSSETSILQLYVANWKLNNCFLSPFYISNILCLIDSLNCETLLIHGTLIGKRAYILSAIIFLYDNLKNKIETCQELTENTINDALMEFNTITKTKKFTKFEYEIIIISLFAHFIKKGNIQSNELEQKLKNQFKEIYEY
ncbi:Hypothetical protein SRAE_2000101700 [Strongyloides ratti]|uniref:Uncharacterized protein n=1 Tax=Strongyloides ratti TaxID=34506 RepID=A0A090L9C2_STRRB|nr:Hypothetical protein SRAE_2000101700 [Strongyloides ratti]CEF66347.1 Hypothetical protein SRAE_2000101700 [Strongyloides ratti]